MTSTLPFRGWSFTVTHARATEKASTVAVTESLRCSRPAAIDTGPAQVENAEPERLAAYSS